MQAIIEYLEKLGFEIMSKNDEIYTMLRKDNIDIEIIVHDDNL